MASVRSKLASRSGIVAGSGVANPMPTGSTASGSRVANPMATGSTAAGSGWLNPGSAPNGRAQAMEALWISEDSDPALPCVDCGLNTGNFCDGGMSCAYDKCFAAERVPADYGERDGQSVMNGKQRTPLCSYCETLHEFCRFCRGVHSCTPPMVQSHWSGVPQRKSREFTPHVAVEVVESWELEKCVCKKPFPLGRLIPGEKKMRCFECLRPYVPARENGSCSPRPRLATGCQP